VINHCSNDFKDNIKSLGYHFDLWKPANIKSERSVFHIVNFVKHITHQVAVKKQDQGGPTKEGVKSTYAEDELWTIKHTTPMKLPQEVTINRRLVNLRGYKKSDWYFRNNTFTQVQGDLYRESLRFIHRLLSGRNIPILHTFIYRTPDEYIAAVTELINEIDGYGNNPVILGRVPANGSYDKDHTNTHSGAHYTPDFNKHWAEIMNHHLKESLL